MGSAAAQERPGWTGPTQVLPVVDGSELVRPYVLAVTGSCRWCRRPIVLSPGQVWLHTDLTSECMDRWGWPIPGRTAAPVPRAGRHREEPAQGLAS
jgi:hypothetical protein